MHLKIVMSNKGLIMLFVLWALDWCNFTDFKAVAAEMLGEVAPFW